MDHSACTKRIAQLDAENARLREQIENQLRIRDLGKVERAELFRRERDRGLSGARIARRYGYKSGPYVNNRIRILDHGAAGVIEAWRLGYINDAKAEELARQTRSHAELESRLRAFRSTRRSRSG